MDIQALWEKALAETDIIRSRLKTLSSTSETALPYAFLAPSDVNEGDTVIRRGEVVVGKPSIILPNDMPQFGGFNFDNDIQHSPDTVTNFLLIRGIHFPSLKFNNMTSAVDVFEGNVDEAIKDLGNKLERQEDISTTLLVGPNDAWQFSILIFIGMQIGRSIGNDLKAYIDAWNQRKQK